MRQLPNEIGSKGYKQVRGALAYLPLFSQSSRISFSILEEDRVAFSSSCASSIDRSDLAAMINKATAISI